MAEYRTTTTTGEPMVVERRSGAGRTLAISAVIALAIVALLFATGFFSAKVSGGAAPQVSVSGGALPNVDLDSKKVVVGTHRTIVDVPTVQTRRETVSVPTVGVTEARPTTTAADPAPGARGWAIGGMRLCPRPMTDHAPDPALLAKAETLTEALPYLQRYAGSTFVVKYGGHAMGDPERQRDFAEDMVLLKAVGINPVVVHGGGPQIGSMLKRLGVESRFVDGLRVTDAETARVAEMVLAGSINKEIVGWIGQAGGRAVGISGKDAGLVTAEKVGGRREADAKQGIERHVDLGFVGEPVAVDRALIDTLSTAGIIPVIAPIALGVDGQTYNINADTMAGAIAGALGAARFFLLTDVVGVLDKAGALLTDLDPARIAGLTADGTISGGMIPKVETCVGAVEAGVDAAVIIDGRVPHAILLEIFTRRGAGTLVRRGT